MSAFPERWLQSKEERGFGRRKVSLQQLLDDSKQKIQIQIEKLTSITTEIVGRDQKLYVRLVRLLQEQKKQEAGILANEIAELRKVIRIVGHSKIALEQISIRIASIKELGEIAVTLAPATATIRGVQNNLKPIVPEAEGVFEDIADNLRGIIQDSSQPNESAVSLESTSEEAAKILEEAASVVGTRVEETLPSVPAAPQSKVTAEPQAA